MADWREHRSPCRVSSVFATTFATTLHGTGCHWLAVSSQIHEQHGTRRQFAARLIENFKSVVPAASCRKEGSTPLHSRQFNYACSVAFSAASAMASLGSFSTERLPKRIPNRFAASSSSASESLTYTAIVNAADECPNRCWTVLGCAFISTKANACACLRWCRCSSG